MPHACFEEGPTRTTDCGCGVLQAVVVVARTATTSEVAA